MFVGGGSGSRLFSPTEKRSAVMTKIGVDGYFLGVDVGTQGTKSILCDGRDGRVVGSEREEYPLVEKADGTREQDPALWVKAVTGTIRKLLKTAGVKGSSIRCIGISGQQHGFVPVDGAGKVIRNAKLWNDTSTHRQCDTIIGRLGGEKKVLELTGNNVLPGYTAPKVLWLKENEPDNYRKLALILLPHDYINFYLTGEKKMEAGDASGTAFFDVRNRKWSEELLGAIDGERNLLECLPPIIPSVQPVGVVRKEALEAMGLDTGLRILVSSGGGDNMMGAIGTGNTKKGVVTVSLGTSGTIYAYSDFPVVDPAGEFAAFCDSTGGWLPLACTMNVTVATELVKRLFSMSNEQLESAVRKTAPGAGGLVLLPYFGGERTPNVPSGTGVLFGVNEFTMNDGHFARAAMEGVTLGIRYGLESMKKQGIRPKDIRLTGGGSKSGIWRQVAADVFDAEAVNMEIDEAAGFGAAIQAMWCYANHSGQKTDISSLADAFVKLREDTRTKPVKKTVDLYNELYELQTGVSGALRRMFETHRRIISRG
jgi:xylulokinase